jgi:hypothetical protein
MNLSRHIVEEQIYSASWKKVTNLNELILMNLVCSPIKINFHSQHDLFSLCFLSCWVVEILWCTPYTIFTNLIIFSCFTMSAEVFANWGKHYIRCTRYISYSSKRLLATITSLGIFWRKIYTILLVTFFCCCNFTFYFDPMCRTMKNNFRIQANRESHILYFNKHTKTSFCLVLDSANFA